MIVLACACHVMSWLNTCGGIPSYCDDDEHPPALYFDVDAICIEMRTHGVGMEIDVALGRK